MRKQELTGKQREVLEIVAAWIAKYGFPPTIRDIAKALGVASTNGVVQHLNALERKGHIMRDSRRSRGIKLLRTNIGPRMEDAPATVLAHGGQLEQGIRIAVTRSGIALKEAVATPEPEHILLDPALFAEGVVRAWKLDVPVPALHLLRGDIAVVNPSAHVHTEDLVLLGYQETLDVRRVFFLEEGIALDPFFRDQEFGAVMPPEQFGELLLGKIIHLVRPL